MKEPRDAYKVLQVDPEADDDVIQAAYRRLAQKHHPDVASPGADADAKAARMVELNAAWDQLRNPARRSAYDRQRAWAAASSAASAASTARPTAAAPAGSTSPSRPASVRESWSGQSPTAGADGAGSAGPPPGHPSGSVLTFGRFSGWSLGEIARVDPGYLEWLDRMPIGRPYRAELDAMLRRLGRRLGEAAEAKDRRGLFRRR